MVRYDAEIIEKFAAKLYAQANRIVAMYVVLFGIAGVIAGIVATKSTGGSMRDTSLPVPNMILGGVVLAALGYIVGQARAFSLRLQAQTALCQVQIERNTAKPG